MVTVTILTQSAEYVELVMDDGVASIASPEGVDILDITAMNPTCLVASSFTWFESKLSLSLAHSLALALIHCLSLSI